MGMTAIQLKINRLAWDSVIAKEDFVRERRNGLCARQRSGASSPSRANVSERLKIRGRKGSIVSIMTLAQEHSITRISAKVVVNTSNASSCHVSILDVIQRTHSD
jgi:hypothetical protein